MSDEEVMNAYDAGWSAAKRGEHESDCPYAVGSEERKYWINGFDDGDGQ